MEKFKTVKEFCDAVKSGKNVYWSDTDYVIKFDNHSNSHCDLYYIYCLGTKLRLNTVITEYHNRSLSLQISPEFVLSEYFVK